jgi:hypothetical protein
MRVRALSSTGDYTFGQNGQNWLVNSAAGVVQVVLSRLNLWEGQWFLDLADGTPVTQSIIGKNPQIVYDAAIQNRIAQTPGVVKMLSYSSSLTGRALTVVASFYTAYSTTPITITAVLTT